MLKYKNIKKHLTNDGVAGACVSLSVAVSFVMLCGFDKPPVHQLILHTFQWMAFVYFLVIHIRDFRKAEGKWGYICRNWYQIPLLLALVTFFFFSPISTSRYNTAEMSLLVLTWYLVVQVMESVCRFILKAASGLNPMRTFVLSFLTFIVLGAGLLELPRFHNGSLSFLDACFTSTSAVCVTGLVVKDTGTDFTTLGQLVILTLMQLGGFGIVVFGSIFALLFGKAFSVKETVAMQDLLNSETSHKISKMVAFILTATIIIEVIGALGLWQLWDGISGSKRLLYSVFHSVSAFCNAGFALFSDSFVGFKSMPQVYLVICPLIIIGGLGFLVLYNIAEIASYKLRGISRRLRDPGKLHRRPFVKLSFQSNVVLCTTAVLLVFGTFVFLFFESTKISAADNTGGFIQRLADCFFMSVTCRTAGFNTVDVAALSDPSKLFAILLMLIGGSPGSTAGGMKTVTLFVIIMAVWAAVRQKNEAEAFKRSIRLVIVARALTVAMFYTVAYITTTLALCYTERFGTFGTLDLMFESASALGTVGLSTGVTPHLTSAGKLVITFAMFFGRLGPLTILASLILKINTAKYSYPDEPLIIG
ncbi:MAG: TrkH family potassium uptake protein [Phycisphaerae bacterium]|jgi:trk system potassium uptake protein TrkH